MSDGPEMQNCDGLVGVRPATARRRPARPRRVPRQPAELSGPAVAWPEVVAALFAATAPAVAYRFAPTVTVPTAVLVVGCVVFALAAALLARRRGLPAGLLVGLAGTTVAAVTFLPLLLALGALVGVAARRKRSHQDGP
jgi:hypothetical protein